MAVQKIKSYFDLTPGKMRLRMVLCVLSTVLMGIVYYHIYSDIKQTIQTVGKDTAPSIIAAQDVYAYLADANANAINAKLINEDKDEIFWEEYHKAITRVHLDLVPVIKNITYSPDLLHSRNIMVNIQEYEDKIGDIRNSANGKDIFTVNSIMQQELLPSAKTLANVNYSYLELAYKSHIDRTIINYLLFGVPAFVVLAVLILAQYYLFRRTRRRINIGLFLATAVYAIFLVYASISLYTAEKHLIIAKENAFDSVYALGQAKAVSYDTNADETLFLVFHGEKSSQEDLTAQFNKKARAITDIGPQQAIEKATAGQKFGGFLGEELSNITFPGESKAAAKTLKEWSEYINTDQKIRELEYQGKHDEAVVLCLGKNPGQLDYQFDLFDNALQETKDINLRQFYSHINIASGMLNSFPIVLAGIVVLILALSIWGINQRLTQYRE